MAQVVTLIKDTPINGETYSKGTTISVSESIYETLKAEGAIKEKAPKEEA